MCLPKRKCSILSSFQYRPLSGVLSMAFSRSLNTKEMAEYIIRNFQWDRRGIALPSSPLPRDFQALCPSYELAVVEEAAERFELPELHQVIFYAMLLNEADRLGVLHGRALRTLESNRALLEWLRVVWLYGDRIFEARFWIKVEPEGSSGAGKQEEDSKAEQKGESSATKEAASLSDNDKQE
ncbi:LOW QUALITY PROTEIN: hypothetical protein Cgig2_001789 [Carnegiea gigantea]|uniref:Uncharacterized protein n=1 Tax=Carnegiea gigantea TaxID=171969 RepID=A0A9Q1QIF2_9CARY|nr:LOW QUALITY PROTEIN: hypothetical protein Cgig2_001789 [Carnegiea gigantea]